MILNNTIVKSGITPTGTISITENGTHDVTQYATADVNVPSGGDDPYPVRNDGKTHLWVVVDDPNYMMVSIAIGVNKYYTDNTTAHPYIDWGDGSPIESISKSYNLGMQHTYAQLGTYEIVASDGETTGTIRIYSASCLMGGTDGYGNNTLASYQNGSRLVALEVGGSAAASYLAPKSHAISQCPNLKKVTLPDTTGHSGRKGLQGQFYTNLGVDMAPSGCESYELGGGGATLATGAFKGFSSLRSMDLSTVAVGGTVNSVFNGCTSLRSVTLWDAMSGVGTSMFDGCKSLRTIDLPAAVASIGESGFNDCWSLQSITIPAAVTTIGANAFANCYSMASITFLPTTPPTVDDANAWTNLPTTCTIHVPSGTLADYTAAANYPDPATYTYVED